MHVRVKQQVLPPGVQNAEEADGGSQVFGISRDLQQGVGAGLEQQTVDLLLVLQGERVQLMRQREDDVEVAHRQHFGLSLGDPAVAGRGLTLGTVAIAAGVIGDGLMPALGALVAMAAQSGGAATLDGAQHFDMRPVQPAPALFDEAGARSANNVGHLDGWPVHLLARLTRPFSVVEDETGISSSGLATEVRCFRDRCR